MLQNVENFNKVAAGAKKASCIRVDRDLEGTAQMHNTKTNAVIQACFVRDLTRRIGLAAPAMDLPFVIL